MNTADRKKLTEALGDLPEGFGIETYDDFVNFRATIHGSERFCRVIRIVGPGRHLVLFSYPEPPFKHSTTVTRYQMLYLDEQGDLQEFNPKRVHQVYNEEHGHNVGWERAVGEWLDCHGAAAFKGRGWTEPCARRIHNLITRWQKHYSG